MVVVVILGILAAMAIPRFSISAHKSKEKEAELILKHVLVSQEAHFIQFGSYGTTVDELRRVGFERPAPAQYYEWRDQVELPLCLASTGTHSGRQIDSFGNITNC